MITVAGVCVRACLRDAHRVSRLVGAAVTPEQLRPLLDMEKLSDRNWYVTYHSERQQIARGSKGRVFADASQPPTPITGMSSRALQSLATASQKG